MAVPKARVEQTAAGLVPQSEGWFVANARDLRWTDRPGQGASLPLTGWTAEEVESLFGMLGLNLRYAGPGQAISSYHREPEQEGFLVLKGDGVALVEGTEQPVGEWDFVHCPPGTAHSIVGGEHGIVVLCAGSRVVQAESEDGGTEYLNDPVAVRHGAAAPELGEEPYARYPDPVAAPFRDPWLG